MPTLAELLHERSGLHGADVEWLHLLVGDWQLLSDLSFTDLVLWVRLSPVQWEAVAHIRPTTGQMVFFEDQVGIKATREMFDTTLLAQLMFLQPLLIAALAPLADVHFVEAA